MLNSCLLSLQIEVDVNDCVLEKKSPPLESSNLLLSSVESKVTLTVTLISMQEIIDGKEVGNIIGNKALVN